MLEQAGFLATLWSGVLFLYVFQEQVPTIPNPYLPIFLMGILVLYLCVPIPSFSSHSGGAFVWTVKVCWRMATAPFHSVRFEDFWLADQFNSIVIFMLDIEFMICFVSYGQFRSSGEATCRSSSTAVRPIIAALPAWWRFAQCIRRYLDSGKGHHLVNAGKYFSTLTVVTFSALASVARDYGEVLGEDNALTAYFTCWVALSLISTVYALYWDLVKDWGLFSSEPGVEHRFLRRELLYPVKFYYCAIGLDVVLRFLWTLSVSVGFFGTFFSDGLVAVLALCEFGCVMCVCCCEADARCR